MDEPVFSLVFAAIGMTTVFVVITILTLAIVATGILLRGHEQRRREATVTADGTISAEHLAIIAAAIEVHQKRRSRP